MGFIDGVNLYSYLRDNPVNASDPSGNQKAPPIITGIDAIEGGIQQGTGAGEVFRAPMDAISGVIDSATNGEQVSHEDVAGEVRRRQGQGLMDVFKGPLGPAGDVIFDDTDTNGGDQGDSNGGDVPFPE